MSIGARSYLVGLASLGVVASLVAAAPAPAAAPDHSRGASPPGVTSTLQGVSALSADDAWAVGYTQFYPVGPEERRPVRRLPVPTAVAGGDLASPAITCGFVSPDSCGTLATLVEHWDGSTWSAVPSPNPSASSRLESVSALSSTDVWATGEYTVDGTGIDRGLILHWNGVDWVQVPSLDPGQTYGTYLHSISAVSATDVWVVGSYGDVDQNTHTLVEHWNGVRWLRVLSPNPGRIVPGFQSGGVLQSVTADSATDASAVGFFYNGDGPGSRTLVEHWDGVRWSHVSSPNPGAARENRLSGVSVLSPTNLVTVGYYSNASSPRSLIIQSDGTLMTRVDSPNPGGPQPTLLIDVAASSPTNEWAVGYYIRQSQLLPLIVQGSGRLWSQVASPNPGGSTFGTLLLGVSTAGPGDAWAVGYYGDQATGGASAALLLHWDGTQWSQYVPPCTGGPALVGGCPAR